MSTYNAMHAQYIHTFIHSMIDMLADTIAVVVDDNCSSALNERGHLPTNLVSSGVMRRWGWTVASRVLLLIATKYVNVDPVIDQALLYRYESSCMCRCQILTVLSQNLLGKAGANPPARLSKSPFTNMFQYVVYTFLHCNLKRSFPFSAAANNAIGLLQLTHNAQHSAIVSSLHISSTCSLEVDVLSDCSV